MELKPMRRTIATAAIAAAVSAGAVALPTFAQSGNSSSGGTTTGTTTSGTSTTGTTQKPGRADHQAREAEYRTALAKELGVSVAKLKAAEQAAQAKVFVAHLDEMVSAGRISAADAATLKDAAANGTLPQALKAQRLKEMTQHLSEAVKAGRITQAQADQMLARAKANQGDDMGLGHVPGGMGGMDMGRGGHGRGGHDMGGFMP